MFHVHICLGKCHLGDDTFILIIQKVKRSEKTRRWLAQLTASSRRNNLCSRTASFTLDSLTKSVTVKTQVTASSKSSRHTNLALDFSGENSLRVVGVGVAAAQVEDRVGKLDHNAPTRLAV